MLVSRLGVSPIRADEGPRSEKSAVLLRCRLNFHFWHLRWVARNVNTVVSTILLRHGNHTSVSMSAFARAPPRILFIDKTKGFLTVQESSKPRE